MSALYIALLSTESQIGPLSGATRIHSLIPTPKLFLEIEDGAS